MKIGLLTIIGALTLTGCSSGSLPCNDEDIKATALEIIMEDIYKGGWAQKAEADNELGDYSITDIKTLKHDKDTGFYNCSAIFSYRFRNKQYSENFRYELSYLEDSDDTEVAVYGVDKIKSEVFFKFRYY